LSKLRQQDIYSREKTILNFIFFKLITNKYLTSYGLRNN
jgi:hypothetical protein